MPIYEYECAECGRVHEIMQKMSDPPLTECPHCAGKLQKLISQSTFHLKGSGWYATDYANRNSGSSSAASKESDHASDKSTSKTDSSPKESSSTNSSSTESRSSDA
ncbi:MAG: zinc ribbon domain-containing protein [Desulfobacterales bacterium]|nr:zinc ribbon domain-containing protein [Desulfobacterales bacterium]